VRVALQKPAENIVEADEAFASIRIAKHLRAPSNTPPRNCSWREAGIFDEDRECTSYDEATTPAKEGTLPES